MTKQARKTAYDGTPMPADVLARKVGRFTLTAALARRTSALIDRHARSRDGGQPTVEQALMDIATGRVKIIRKPAAGQRDAAQPAETRQERRKRAA